MKLRVFGLLFLSLWTLCLCSCGNFKANLGSSGYSISLPSSFKALEAKRYLRCSSYGSKNTVYVNISEWVGEESLEDHFNEYGLDNEGKKVLINGIEAYTTKGLKKIRDTNYEFYNIVLKEKNTFYEISVRSKVNNPCDQIANKIFNSLNYTERLPYKTVSLCNSPLYIDVPTGYFVSNKASDKEQFFRSEDGKIHAIGVKFEDSRDFQQVLNEMLIRYKAGKSTLLHTFNLNSCLIEGLENGEENLMIYLTHNVNTYLLYEIYYKKEKIQEIKDIMKTIKARKIDYHRCQIGSSSYTINKIKPSSYFDTDRDSEEVLSFYNPDYDFYVSIYEYSLNKYESLERVKDFMMGLYPSSTNFRSDSSYAVELLINDLKRTYNGNTYSCLNASFIEDSKLYSIMFWFDSSSSVDDAYEMLSSIEKTYTK